jgi:hypothetical protein
MDDKEIVAAQLDAEHEKAKRSYQARDVGGYMAIFAQDLRYRQPNGKTIGHAELARDIASQLASVESAESSYLRESLEIGPNRATEILRQTATVKTRRFLLFRHTWHVERRGRYEWVKVPEGWRIREVEVLLEKVGAADF